MNDVWLGLLSGIAFGFVIQRVGATNAGKMARGHLMQDPAVPMFMLAAVGMAALGLLGLESADIGRTNPLPISLVATTLAAIIFGVGWGLAGYCPGTCWAAAGEGRMDAVFALLGGLAGAAVFAQLHEWLVPMLYMRANLGPLTLQNWIPNKAVATWLLAAAVLAAAWGVKRIWSRSPHGLDEDQL